MHLLAAHDFLSWCNIIHNSEYEVSLDITDSVLQWTPLQYAIKLEKWDTVERLLERNVDRSGLDMIKQKAHDPGYIDPIILEAAGCRRLLLLEFLCSIGVKIHQSRIGHFFFPLVHALEDEELSVIRFLIQLGADCNTRYSDGRTPLFIAVTKGSLDVVRMLVEEGGASVDVTDNVGRTVIEEAFRCLENACQSHRQVREKIVEYLEERMSEKRRRICIIS
jgi:ankyrin repeat protein